MRYFWYQKAAFFALFAVVSNSNELHRFLIAICTFSKFAFIQKIQRFQQRLKNFSEGLLFKQHCALRVNKN